MAGNLHYKFHKYLDEMIIPFYIYLTVNDEVMYYELGGKKTTIESI